MMGKRDLFACCFIERCREPFCEATTVDEDHRRLCCTNTLDEPNVHLRPNASRLLISIYGPNDVIAILEDLFFDGRWKRRGNFDGDGEDLLCRGIHDLDRPWNDGLSFCLCTSKQARDFFERLLR